MRVGFTVDMRNAGRRPWKELWEDNLWLLEQAEALGFDYVMVQEHFFCDDGYSPSLPVFLALLVERTADVRIGSYAYVLPLHHAAMLAQETAVLDHLCGGRLDVTVGAGHRATEYRALGYSPKSRPSRMEEGLDVLKLAWTQRPFSYRGRYYELDDIEVVPAPLQEPHPPLWVAATSVAAAERAGRHGAHLAAASGDPAVYDSYLGARRAAGLVPETGRRSLGISVTTTREPADKVWARNRHLYFERRDFYRRIRAEMGDAPLEFGLSSGEDAYRDQELIGDPEFVTQTLNELRTKLPLTDFVLSGFPSGVPIRTEVYDGLRLFASEVLPEVKSW